MEVAMRSFGAIALLAAVLFGTPAWAQSTMAKPEAKADKGSQAFITKAIEGNYAEVEMGKLAQQNGHTDGMKSFGQMLVTDHSSANEKAIAAAKEIGVTPPTGPTAKQKHEYERLSKMKGASFDKSFAQHMVTDHKKDISEYEREAKKHDPVGRYANESLPVLRKHLHTAESLEKSAGKSAAR
jgi:putative membrane protein